MRNADKVFASLVLVAAALAACSKPQAEANNVALETNAAIPPDIETLPADESSATPSNELVNGSDNSDVNATDNSSGNGY
jgi:hypothetical protein